MWLLATGNFCPGDRAFFRGPKWALGWIRQVRSQSGRVESGRSASGWNHTWASKVRTASILQTNQPWDMRPYMTSWTSHDSKVAEAGGGGFESYPQCRMIWGGRAASMHGHILAVLRPFEMCQTLKAYQIDFFQLIDGKLAAWPFLTVRSRHRQHPRGPRCMESDGQRSGAFGWYTGGDWQKWLRNDCETQGDQAKLWTGAPRSLESFRCCYWIDWAFTKYILTTKLGASSETMTWCGFFMDQVI